MSLNVVLGLDRHCLVLEQVIQFLHQPFCFIGHFCVIGFQLLVAPQPLTSPRLIKNIDGLVWQKAVCDIPFGHINRGLNGFICEDAPMVLLISAFEPMQDINTLFNSWLWHHHRLKPPLQGCILLNILTVFLKGCGPNQLQLASSHCRLQQIGCICTTLCSSGANQSVNFINHNDDIIALFDLSQNVSKALFKFTTVLCSSDNHSHVQLDDLLANQRVGHLACNNAAGNAFCNGSLADPRFSNKYCIVLPAAAKDLCHTLHFLIAPNQRV
mmetsp:Transcript_72872/g.122731  ORF Transcript_72872/g.122731 Transcript_72872/m.122731 type:complete len:270 (-) Transcript_72872:1303-2112(-)